MRLPMFPLGTVLLPGVVLPLHVFEPRYRALVHDCLAGDGCFGVVLIERGNEVGGGDLRTDLGTIARIVQAAEAPDGRWALVTVGTRRVAVRAWLPDDPYPRAEVEELDDVPPGPGAPARREAVERALRRVLALHAEAGDPVPPLTAELSTDLAAAAFQMAALAGLTPVDAQAVLAAPGTDARLDVLDRLLLEQAELLEFRLG